MCSSDSEWVLAPRPDGVIHDLSAVLPSLMKKSGYTALARDIWGRGAQLESRGQPGMCCLCVQAPGSCCCVRVSPVGGTLGLSAAELHCTPFLCSPRWCLRGVRNYAEARAVAGEGGVTVLA